MGPTAHRHMALSDDETPSYRSNFSDDEWSHRSSSDESDDDDAPVCCTGLACTPPDDESPAFANSVLRKLSFVDPKLLRATCSTSILRKRASILSSSAGDGTEYHELSFEADHIDEFISHNWSTGRWHKFMALALHFNLKFGFAAAAAASTVAFGLIIHGDLPCGYKGPQGYSLGLWCQTFGSIAFVFALLFWHEIGSALGCSGPTCFLDKSCIHQTDSDLKRKGIQSLAAFLAYSWKLVVVYSDTYLVKLWTVYELATFLLMFPKGSIIFRPVSLAKIVAVQFIVAFLWVWLTFIMHSRIPLADVKLNMAGDMFIKCVLAFGFRVWEKELAQIHERVKRFSIADAECYCEEDRALVERNIEGFTAHFGFVDPDTPKAEALDEFNKLVHQEVPKLLKDSFGRLGIPIQFIWAIFLPVTLQHTDRMACECREHVSIHIVIVVIRGLVSFLALDPLTVAINACASRYMLNIWTCLAVFFAGALSSVIPYLLWWGLYILGERSIDSKISLAVYLGSCCILLSISYLIYRPKRTTQNRLRMSKSRTLPSAVCDEQRFSMGHSASRRQTFRQESTI